MKRNNFISIALATMALWLGLQNFHVYLPGVIDYLTTYFKAEEQAGYALATFALALLLPLVYRVLGARWLLIVTVGGTAVIRLIIQFTDSQIIHLVLSTIGVVLWIWFIPFWHQSRRNRPKAGDLPGIVIAFPLAIFLDTASRALIWFDEIAWQHTWWAAVVIIAMIGVTVWLLWQELKVNSELSSVKSEEPALRRLLPFLGIGPALYLTQIILTNPARMVGLIPGVDIRWVTLFIVGVTAVGVFEAVEATNFFNLRPWPTTLIIGISLAASLQLFNMGIDPAWLWFGLAALTTWALFGILLAQTSRIEPLKPGFWRDGVVTFLALALMLLIFFMVDEFGMLFMNVVAGILIFLAAIWAAWVQDGKATAVPAGLMRVVAAVLAIAILIVGVWAWFSQPVAVDGVPFTAVFKNGENGYACYRIPGIVRAGDGSLVAFAEGRVENCGDGGGVIRVVARRSTDNGRSWGSLMVIGENVDVAGVEHVAQSPTALVDLIDPANPQGNLFLFFNRVRLERNGLQAQRVGERSVWLAQSADHGLNWSEPVEITEQVMRQGEPDNWREQVSAVGHAIQLRGGIEAAEVTNGRLFVMAQSHIDGATRNYAFWSDDHGQTWQIGGVNPHPWLDEVMAVERADGGIIVNSRNYDENRVRVGYRAVTHADFDADGNIYFDEAYTDTNLQSPTVQASIQRYSWPDEAALGGQNRILFSIPDHARLRTNMTVRLSYDEGDTWPIAKVIDPGPAAYSDLVVDEEGDIGLIYERGNAGGIYYTSFSLDWLTDGEDSTS